MNRKHLPHGITVLAFVLFIVLGLACGSSEPAVQRANSQTPPQVQQQQQPTSQTAQSAQNTPQPAPQPTSVYYTGNGGREMTLGILLPQSQGLNEAQNYLPSMVQGVLVSDISKYSAISVMDRVSLDRVIAETLDPTYEEDLDIVSLGRVAQVRNMMTGSIIKTATGFSLQINITDTTPNANTIASYSGTCTAAELDDHTAIHRASLELLSQAKVQLTARARNELARASTQETISAQTALAQGITAQRQGTEVTALSYYLRAAAFDPSMPEIENRLEILTASITSGSAGADARNDIALRRQWIERLQETETFYRNYTREAQSYYLIYDTDVKHGTVNYQNETVVLSFGIRLVPDAMWVHTLNEVILTVEKGLRATGRAETWGLDWPDNVVSMTSPFAARTNNFAVAVEIVNDQGTSIGRGTVSIPYGFTVRNGMTIPKQQWEGTASVPNVDTRLITDRLTVRISSIDGIHAEDAARQKKISIMPSEEFALLARPGGHSATNESFFTVRDDGTLTAYTGTQTNVSIPSIVKGVWIVEIGEGVFKDKGLTSLTIPNGVRIIGNRAFENNRLTSVTIPDSVRSIGNSAFYDRVITRQQFNFTIGANVLLGINLFNETIFAHSDFPAFYNQNGKRAGIYTGKYGSFGTFTYRTWTY